MKKYYSLSCTIILLVFVWSCQNETPTTPEQIQSRTQNILTKVNEINKKLASKNFLQKSGATNVRLFLNELFFYKIDGVNLDDIPDEVIVLSSSRWVAGDARRLADGNNLTYLTDRSDGATSSGLSNSQTTAALESGLRKYNRSLNNLAVGLDLVGRNDTGADPDIFDSFFGFGGSGNPFLADIVQAGFLPGAFFDAVVGPGGKEGVLAFAISFIFGDVVDGVFIPSDIDNNGRLDRALVEVYYNDFFGDPNGSRAGNPWATAGAPLPAIDVPTVGLHENGHSLDVGHIPTNVATSIMNPIYAGPQLRIDPFVVKNLNVEYGTWPNP